VGETWQGLWEHYKEVEPFEEPPFPPPPPVSSSPPSSTAFLPSSLTFSPVSPQDKKDRVKALATAWCRVLVGLVKEVIAKATEKQQPPTFKTLFREKEGWWDEECKEL